MLTEGLITSRTVSQPRHKFWAWRDMATEVVVGRSTRLAPSNTFFWCASQEQTHAAPGPPPQGLRAHTCGPRASAPGLKSTHTASARKREGGCGGGWVGWGIIIQAASTMTELSACNADSSESREGVECLILWTYCRISEATYIT